MSAILKLVLPFILLFGISSEDNIQNNIVQETTTYYFIRHAEKDRSNKSEKDPNLTAEGLKRAQIWAEVLKDIPLDMVLSTNYKRTLQTGAPIAGSKQLSMENYNAGNGYDDEFRKRTSGKRVLVVGHSNTTPQFVNEILGEEKYADIDDTENGALFIVQVLPNNEILDQVLYIN
ncbi:histidine phosphatase family protein [uncultured Christiangramia sp.]|uniref:SixA phosphatase family protein n=1 Tax=uncultured Christiangramia sp. TaxID=503836 RepID=UPI0025D5BE9F|nr:phosphoglycerate mutase family protein [uncultured Christiangramia sp.]|tara:strand:- start:6661 stop:7185 length:525 start_codon:yes stop_codon:yes gene_type:complete